MEAEQWNIECCKCGKFLFSERRIYPEGQPSKIEYINGYYDGDYYFNEFADEFYCLDCAKKYNKLLDFGRDGRQRNCYVNAYRSGKIPIGMR